MSLPVLNDTTFEPTGVTLSLSDYFNPTLNPNYTSLDTYGLSGLVLLNKIVEMAKHFSGPDTYKELMKVVNWQHTHNLYTSNMEKVHEILYNALPEDKKWLIFWMAVYANRTMTANSVEYSAYLAFPYEVYRNELNRDSYTYKIILNSDTGEVSQQRIDTFVSSFSGIFPLVFQKFEEFGSQRIYATDGLIPYFFSTVYRYAHNLRIFKPTGDSTLYTVPFDTVTPAKMKTYLQGNHRITLKYEGYDQNVSWSCAPPVGSRKHLERVLNYSTNVLEYLPYTIKGPKEQTSTLYGIELEACSDYKPAEIIKAQKELFFLLKQDGSISGSKRERYEMVTVPASVKAHKRLWAEFFSTIDYTNFDTTKDTGNGMHVHIDRKTFKTNKHINRLCWFITNPANEEFIFTISERPTRANFQQWANVPNYTSETSRYTAAKKSMAYCKNLRGAVHFKGEKTVEIRMFKGLVSYATVIKNLEFVDSVVEFTRFATLSQVTFENYLAWLNATPKNKYETLKLFISEIKIEDMKASAKLNDYLFGALNNDDRIETLLNKAPFKVTNQHITLLNKKRRKRTFVLKDGKVVCTYRRGGLLAKLDLSVQQKQTRGAATFAMTSIN